MDRLKAYRQFHALLDQLGLRERKCDILAGYGVRSTAELTDAQLSAAIYALSCEAKRKKDAADDRLRACRSSVLRLLTDIGVYRIDRGDSRSVVWKRANSFVLQPKIAGKAFYDLSADELQRLAVKLRALKAKGYWHGDVDETAHPQILAGNFRTPIPS